MKQEENGITLLGILVKTRERIEVLNALLSEYGEVIIGRMGVPCRDHGLHIICVVLDAPPSQIQALSDRLDCVDGICVRSICPMEQA